jgi:hypothetical protein
MPRRGLSNRRLARLPTVPIMRAEFAFRHRGVDGLIEVSLQSNDDPERWGWPLLGLDVPLEYLVGFPVLEATVEYPAEGYAAVLGWVQVVRYRASDEPDEVVLADVAPQLQGLGMPYVAFGVRPAFFDAPAISAPDADWRAWTFLTATPDVLMTRVVAPVCGFRWGYRRSGGSTELVEPVRASAEDWLGTREELTARYPAWEWRPDPV